MTRCPMCNSRDGFSFDCLNERCDVFLFSDDIKEEFCAGEGCWCCDVCDYVSEHDFPGDEDGKSESLYDEIRDAYDVDDYVLTDNIDWTGERD